MERKRAYGGRLRRAVLITIALFAAIVSTSCGGRVYSGQWFTYPAGVDIEDPSIQYFMNVTVVSKGRHSRRGEKNVDIRILDKGERELLRDHYEFTAASVEASATWDSPDRIQLELLEVGYRKANDPYNRALMKSGPRKLRTINYRYDAANKRFVRVD